VHHLVDFERALAEQGGDPAVADDAVELHLPGRSCRVHVALREEEIVAFCA